MKIDFSADEQEAVKRKLMDYMGEELNLDIGGFEAWFLIEFIMNEVGPYCYKQGLQDAQAAMAKRFAHIMDQVEEDVFQLEINADLQKD